MGEWGTLKDTADMGLQGDGGHRGMKYWYLEH